MTWCGKTFKYYKLACQGVDGGASFDSSDYKSYFIAIYVYNFHTIGDIDCQIVKFTIYSLYNEHDKTISGFGYPICQ